MIFTAYMDESGTNGPSPTVIMAAVVGSDHQWKLLGRKLRRIQRDYGFTIFHAKELRDKKGEFRSWSNEKGQRLVYDLAESMRTRLVEAVTMALPRALYEAEYRNSPTPKGMLLDSQYGVCFRACMQRLVQIATEDSSHNKIDVVLEDGHKNSGDVIRIFGEMKKDFDEIGFNVLGSIRIEKKNTCWQLMIADFQAHAFHLSERRIAEGLPGYFEMAEKLTPIGGARLTHITHTAETLRGLKANWEDTKRTAVARRQQGRRPKQPDAAGSGKRAT